MATDLTIVESVGEALSTWTPTGSLVPVASIVSGLSKLIFDDSPDIDSLQEIQQETNDNIENMTEQLTSTTESMSTLSDSIQNLTNSIDSFMGFQYFFMGTIFSVLFVGFLGTRIKRLLSWRKLKKMEGYM